MEMLLIMIVGYMTIYLYALIKPITRSLEKIECDICEVPFSDEEVARTL